MIKLDLGDSGILVAARSMSIYTFDMLCRLVVAQMTSKVTTDYPEAQLFAAIAIRESGGDPLASNDRNTNGTIDRGLWQINSVHEKEFPQYPDFRLACYTPSLNVQMAIEIWRKQGYEAWSSFKALP